MKNRRIDDQQRLMKIANSSIMLILARSSAVILVGLSTWILSNVSDMKTAIAVIGIEISGFERRIENLEAQHTEVERPLIPIGR